MQTSASAFKRARENWSTVRYTAIKRTVESLDSCGYSLEVSKSARDLILARAARYFFDLFVHTGNIDPQEWRPEKRREKGKGKGKEKGVRIPELSTLYARKLQQILGIRPARPGSLLYDENYKGGEEKPPPPSRLPGGHDALPYTGDDDDYEIEVEDYDVHLSKEVREREEKKGKGNGKGLVIDIYQLGLGAPKGASRMVPSHKKRKQFRGEEKPRMVQETNFFLTINTNKTAPNVETGDNWSQVMTDAMYGLFKEYRNWMMCVKGRESDIVEVERFIDRCNIVGGVEYGGVHKTLHVHLLIHMLHYTRLQIMMPHIKQFIHARFEKVRLWDDVHGEPWLNTTRMRCFFARALRSPDIKRHRSIADLQKPEWLHLVSENLTPSTKERKDLQRVLRRGYLKFFEDAGGMHAHFVLMPPVGWSTVVLAYIFKRGEALENELCFARWNDVIRQQHLYHLFKEHSIPHNFTGDDDGEEALPAPPERDAAEVDLD